MCGIKAPHSLKHLVNLTSFSDEYSGNDYTDKMPPLLVSFESWQPHPVRPTDVSSLPNIMKVAGNSLSNVPWSQIEAASVPSIPTDARCELLKEVSVLYKYGRENLQANFKNIYCPNLQKVLFHPSIEGGITDFFTATQLSQLKFFYGDGISVPDLELLPQAEDLRVLYDEPLTRHSVLPSKLVKLFIESLEPVNGIPSQLKSFALYTGTSEGLTVVDSDTLKELDVASEGPVSIDCPNLTDLTLNVSSIEECKVPNVERLKIELSLFPFQRVPRLRRLYMGGIGISNVPIDSHLEYVYLENVQSSNLLISANIIYVRQDDAFVHSSSATEFSDDYTCQKLDCNSDIKMPKSVESLILTLTSSWDGADFGSRDDLKSICIKRTGSFTLTAPKNLEKLRILDVRDPVLIRFGDTAKLEYIEYFDRALIPQYEAGEVITPPAFVPGGFVQVGPTLWCRPDILQLWKPSSG